MRRISYFLSILALNFYDVEWLNISNNLGTRNVNRLQEHSTTSLFCNMWNRE